MKISFARNSLIEVSSKDKRRIGTNVIILTIKYIINQIIRWRHRPTSSKVGNFKPLSNRDMTFDISLLRIRLTLFIISSIIGLGK